MPPSRSNHQLRARRKGRLCSESDRMSTNGCFDSPSGPVRLSLYDSIDA